jgi:hypothetical protein
MNEGTIESGAYNILGNGNICLGYNENGECTDILVVEVNGGAPSGGIIVIENGKIVPELSDNEESKTRLELEQNIIGINDIVAYRRI